MDEDTATLVVKVAPCCDAWCWRNGSQADCEACEYRKSQEDTKQQDTREQAA